MLLSRNCCHLPILWKLPTLLVFLILSPRIPNHSFHLYKNLLFLLKYITYITEFILYVCTITITVIDDTVCKSTTSP